jgi:hypothetical protein
MMESSLWQMVCTRTSEDPILDIPESYAGRGHGQAPPHPQVSLEQLLAMQNDLMRRLVENDERHRAEHEQPRHKDQDYSYSDFLATHPPIFADVIDPLEVDKWPSHDGVQVWAAALYGVQKTLYTTKQL